VAELAVYLELWAGIFKMFVHPIVTADFLGAAEAFDYKARTFHFNMFLKIFKHSALLHGVARALMDDSYLTKHLFQEFVCYLLIYWLDNFNHVSTIIVAESTWSIAITTTTVI
jgi:hypothetical protein